MFSAEETNYRRPKLKLEVVRGGGGKNGGFTAIGTDEPNDEPEPDYPLNKSPGWFRVISSATRVSMRRLVRSLPTEERRALLRKAKISSRYRILLSWRWGFSQPESITAQDAKNLFEHALSEGYEHYSRSVEERAVWHLWQYWRK